MKRRIDVERERRDVVGDPDGEAALRALVLELGERRRGHCRRELLRGESVSAADHERQLAAAFGECGDDVLEERLGERSRLLRSVEHSDRAHGGRERGHERGSVERSVQANLQHADALVPRREAFDRFLGRTRARAHEHEDALGLRMPDVVEEPVPAPRPLAELRHLLLDDLRYRGVVRVHGLARLEEDVRVLGAAAENRAIGRQGARAMRRDEIVVE